MAFPTTIEACDVNPANNGPAGSDLPATLDDSIRQAFAFIAQLRDGRGMPIGSVTQVPTLVTPAGFLKLNGQAVSRTTYANLFAFASAQGLVTEAAWTAGSFGCFSVGDGSTTFRLPDLRAMTMKGLDESRGIDASRVLGVFQDHLVLNHTHPMSESPHSHTAGDFGHGHGAGTDVQGNHAHTYSTFSTGTFVAAPGGISIGYITGGASNGTSGDGNHAHNVSINTGYANVYVNSATTGITTQNNAGGGAQNLVKNIAWPFYMRY